MDYYASNTTAIEPFEIGYEENKRTVVVFIGYFLAAIYISKQCNVTTKLIDLHLISTIVHTAVIAVLTPVIITTLIIFWIHQIAIQSFLQVKYKDEFWGLLSGSDNFWTLPDKSKNVITILMIINDAKHCGMFYEKFTNHLKETLKSTNNGKLSKMLCVVENFMGYSYLIKEGLQVEDCVRELDFDSYCNEELLQETVSKRINCDMPKHNKGLWEMSIGTREIGFGSKKGFPIIVRFNHCIGDGIALLDLLLTCFKHKQTLKVIEEPEKYDFIQALIKFNIRFVHFFIVLYHLPLVIMQRGAQKPDESILHGQEDLSGKKMVVWCIEDNYKYVDLVKKIKRRLQAGFFEIVATALSASLKDFFERKGELCQNVAIIIPAVPTSIDLDKLGQIDSMYLRNNFSVGIMELPIRKQNQHRYFLLERFGKISENICTLKRSHEYQVNYWLLEIVAKVLPNYILGPIMQSTQCSMVVSNLPGPKKMTVMDGCVLEDLMFWIPHRGTTGVGISIFTYDNRFQLGISIDESYGISKEETQLILDNMFKYFDYLDYESLLH